MDKGRKKMISKWTLKKADLYFRGLGFPGGSVVKNLLASAGDASSIPGSRRSPGGGNGNPHQYSLLGKFHGQRSLAGYSPWGHKELDTTELLSTAQHSTAQLAISPTCWTSSIHFTGCQHSHGPKNLHMKFRTKNRCSNRSHTKKQKIKGPVPLI